MCCENGELFYCGISANCVNYCAAHGNNAVDHSKNNHFLHCKIMEYFCMYLT